MLCASSSNDSAEIIEFLKTARYSSITFLVWQQLVILNFVRPHLIIHNQISHPVAGIGIYSSRESSIPSLTFSNPAFCNLRLKGIPVLPAKKHEQILTPLPF